VLVNVNADDLALVVVGSLDRGGVDAAAAGEDDLGAAAYQPSIFAVMEASPKNWPP
jgi:cobyric acid synthase